MKEDKIFSELIRESAVHKAPTDFTDTVMKKVSEAGSKGTYRPLISPAVLITVGFIVILLIGLGIYLGSANAEPGILEKWFSNLNLNLPVVENSFSLILLALLGAIFVLILFDARVQRRKYQFQ